MTIVDRAKRALRQRFIDLGGAPLDSQGYVQDLEDNLLRGVEADAVRKDFATGAGNELKRKILAVHSSSALAANAFGRWKCDPVRLAMLGVSGFSTLALEWKPSGWFNKWPPNLDVHLLAPAVRFGIESKLTEHLQRKKPKFAEAYTKAAFPKPDTAWWSVREQAEGWDSRHIDVAQLVKHALGLLNGCEEGVRTTLVYVYWEPLNAESYSQFAAHRRETQHLVDQVWDSRVPLAAVSYAELWKQWEQSADPPFRAHVRLLQQRYAVDI